MWYFIKLTVPIWKGLSKLVNWFWKKTMLQKSTRKILCRMKESKSNILESLKMPNLVTLLQPPLKVILCQKHSLHCSWINPNYDDRFFWANSTVMAIRVVEFSSWGRKIFCIRINIPKENYWILSFRLMASCQK